jgi:hypothetical protein
MLRTCASLVLLLVMLVLKQLTAIHELIASHALWWLEDKQIKEQPTATLLLAVSILVSPHNTANRKDRQKASGVLEQSLRLLGARLTNQGPLAISDVARYVESLQAVATAQVQYPSIVTAYSNVWRDLQRAIIRARHKVVPRHFGEAAKLVALLRRHKPHPRELENVIFGWFDIVKATIRLALTCPDGIPGAIECFVALKASALWCSQLTCLCSYAPECREFDDLFAELTAVCAALHFDIECPEQFLSILKVIEAWRASPRRLIAREHGAVRVQELIRWNHAPTR